MRITSEYQNNNRGTNWTDKGSITLEGTKHEIEAIKKALLGITWIKFNEGKLDICEAPEPPFIVDKQLQFHWPLDSTKSISYHEVPPIADIKDGGIYVQHIAGYDGDYKKCAKVMEEIGFECLRSRRREDGQIWEIWYLCGEFFAKGQCKGMKIPAIVDWVLCNIRPGQLMTEGKRWALSID